LECALQRYRLRQWLPNRFEAVAANAKTTLCACKPRLEFRKSAGEAFDRRINLGGMNDFNATARQGHARIINY